jgi:uncharacterized membrane protein YeaQ/YmgE (transglycosylase-associated protein family)
LPNPVEERRNKVGQVCSLIFFGAIIGALARLIVPGRQPMGFLATIAVGIVGAVGGALIADRLDVSTAISWVLALAISTVLVLIVAAIQRRNSYSRSMDPPRQ